jgi:MYXO-CTERM domain-containing protein
MKNRVLVCVLGALALSSVARAALVGDAYTIQVTGGGHTGTYSIPQTALVPLGSTGALYYSASWNPGQEYPIFANDGSGVVVAKVAGLSCVYKGDPQVSVNFSVLSGPAPTTFLITSALQTFSTGLYSAHGSAGATISDLLGDGASLQGLYPGGNAYEALCNETPIADLVPSFAVGPGGTDTRSGAFGPTNYTATSMRAAYDFVLSPFDAASGTSTYFKDPVPAPGAAGLLALGGLAALRRRRA